MRWHLFNRTLAASALLLPLVIVADEVSFNRDVRPILSDRCFACHGPDGGQFGEKWRGGLRLDTEEGAFADVLAVKHTTQKKKRAAKGLAPPPIPKSSRYAIVPGRPDESILVERIMTDDPDDVMPPTDSHLTLSKAEKDILRQWIAEGAKWEGHWAFQAPKRPKLPVVKAKDWPKTEVDRFVLAKLEARGLAPAPEADRKAWLRRVTQDLTGLPPTLAEMGAFLSDRLPNPEGRVVDRLLKSDDYAERMTTIWLDSARYADSNSFQFDNERTMWPWRDWVINAYRQNMPYDQFAKEQLAGDLLPTPTHAQLIATGFNRNHGYSIEGGIIDEEYRVTYANDKTTTFGTVFLGLTMECTRCHDHKYDPLSMTDYYSMFAFFNNSAEVGAPGEKGRHQKAAAPFVEHKTALEGGSAVWQAMTPVSAKAKAQKMQIKNDVVTPTGKIPQNDVYKLRYKTVVKTLRSLHLDALASDGKVGRASHKNFVLTDLRVAVVSEGKRTPVSFAKAVASFNQNNFHVNGAIDKDPATGWAVHPQTRKKQSAGFELPQAVAIPAGAELEVTLAFQSVHKQQVLGSFRMSASSEPLVKLGLSKQADAVRAMVMTEKPRKSFILGDGLFDQPATEVRPTTPAVLSSFDGFAPNRLGLSEWLAAPENPLFARVTVNRIWQQFFGKGLVRTPDNFGLQGEMPTHAQLLDWLAVELRESGWDQHHLIRKIVLSATYAQASNQRAGFDDFDNRLLARGASYRLPAEMIRDQALATSGLLAREVGGPSVRPYQPLGVWEDLNAPRSHAEVYRQDKGAGLYRKSMYTYWRRAALHPAMAVFNAPSRDVCTVERESTNTPLQALAILHDPTYVEAARVMAERFSGDSHPVEIGFQTILTRSPAKRELQLLKRLHAERSAHYGKNPQAAGKLVAVGNKVADSAKSAAEVAALADVYHAIFNLSETITRK